MAVDILSTRSVNSMAVEYPSLKPYWLSDSNVNFLFSYLCSSNNFLGFLKIGIKWKLVCSS